MSKHNSDSKSSYHHLSSTKEFLQLRKESFKVSLLTMSIHKRIKQTREKIGLSKGELARRIGLSRAAISQWELEGPEATSPDGENLLKCAKALNVNPEWLQFGKGSPEILPPYENYEKINAHQLLATHLSWTNVDQLIDLKLKGCLNSENIKKLPHKEIVVVLPEGKKLPENHIVLTVKGEAMIPEKSDRLTLWEGDKVIIDLDNVNPLSKNIVFFMNKKSKKAMLRQYMQEGNDFYLRALNKDKDEYPNIPHDKNIEILGIVMHVQRDTLTMF